MGNTYLWARHVRISLKKATILHWTRIIRYCRNNFSAVSRISDLKLEGPPRGWLTLSRLATDSARSEKVYIIIKKPPVPGEEQFMLGYFFGSNHYRKSKLRYNHESRGLPILH